MFGIADIVWHCFCLFMPYNHIMEAKKLAYYVCVVLKYGIFLNFNEAVGE